MKDLEKAFVRKKTAFTYLKNLKESGLNNVRSLEAAAKHCGIKVSTVAQVAWLTKDVSEIIAIINPSREQASEIKEWLKKTYNVSDLEIGEIRKMEKEAAFPEEYNDEN